MKIGSTQERIVDNSVLVGAPVTVTPFALSRSASAGSTRTV
jgi:hypothetical protein